MALNNSGPISLRGTTAGQSIQQELSLSGQISLLDTAVRTLAGVPSGPVTMPTNFYGKANAFVFNQTISSNTNDYNLRNAAIAAGWDQVLVLQATVTINSGVFVGSSSTGTAAFSTGSSFPTGSILSVINNGSIVGRGGNGGSASGGLGSAGGGGGGVFNGSAGSPGSPGNTGANGTNTSGGAGGARAIQRIPGAGGGSANYSGTSGSTGGLALLIQYATTITNNDTIGGGGGGGGGGSGTVRTIFQAGEPVLIIVAGAGGNGGNLGSAGSAGETIVAGSANGGAGGAAGAAVNGNSNITWVAFGTRLGAVS